MKKIFAFAGSNSSKSINHQLISYVGTLLPHVEVLRLIDYDFPMYGQDAENNHGFPTAIMELLDKLKAAEVVIVSCPEHNGSTPAYFKSILDWLSRTRVKYLENTRLIILSASPGGGAAKKGAEAAEKVFNYAKPAAVSHFHFPKFYDNFSETEVRITNTALDEQLKAVLRQIEVE